MKRYFGWVLLCVLLLCDLALSADWMEKESRHFRVVSRPAHLPLTDHILKSAENALAQIRQIMDYEPSEKIVINTYDVNDYGGASATTVPHNYIWLDLAPLEPGYENIPYTERLSWLISHELVHIVVNDLASDAERVFRVLFGKVQPEQVHPLSVPYSLLTNYSRYTPRWHQEGIAVLLETWLNGGFGRAMGSYDEMYFRSLVDEAAQIPDPLELETTTIHHSPFIEQLYYVYGGRFALFLTFRFGPEKVMTWYNASKGASYQSFRAKAEELFAEPLDELWGAFVQHEREFQRENINRLRQSATTDFRRLCPPRGSVTHPYFDRQSNSILWGEHRPHELSSLVRLNLGATEMKRIGTLPTPSLHQVASTAYDLSSKTLFYTTNNNQLARDLWALDVESGETTLLLENCRIGSLTISSGTREMWGVRHSGGQSILSLLNPPYRKYTDLVYFDFGDEVHGLSSSPDGKRIATVLHKSNGDQLLVVVDADSIRTNGATRMATVTKDGSPENPAWSMDGRTLYWNAFTNGVSNIYRYDLDSASVQPLSHVIRGLVKPIPVGDDSLFAFEFSSEGFVPVIMPIRPAQRLPAIRYFGQVVAEQYPQLGRWGTIVRGDSLDAEAHHYDSFGSIALQSVLPVVSGFQSQKVVGLYAHLADPILTHDLTLEAGITPFGERGQSMRGHMKLKYEYRKEYEISWDHNGTDFYDLFNNRKRGMLGNKIRFANTHFWLYDNPHKTKQTSDVVLYTNVSSINDNIVRVSQPDFMVAQTAFNSQSLRRAIGSGDFESGHEYNIAVMVFGSDPRQWQSSINVYADWDFFTSLFSQHNVLHTRLSAGWHQVNDRLVQSRFYFGGFGNRALENIAVKQFRKTFSMPGIPVFSLGSDRFAKLLLENNFPPIRFTRVAVGNQYLSHADLSVFSQALLTKSDILRCIVDVGVQLNLVLRHWHNLESTLSAGAARAWVGNRWSDEWFISFKVLKN